MKMTLYLFILLMLVNCTSYLKNLKPYDGFKGSPVEVEYSMYDSKLEKDQRIYTVVNYDSEGRKVKRSSFHSNGLPTKAGHVYYKYDKTGNIIRTISYYNDGKVLAKVYYKYNKKGDEIEKVIWSNNKKTITKTSYNKNKSSAIHIRTDNEGVIKEYSILKYNAKGEIVKISGLDSIGKPIIKAESEFDKYGNKTKFSYYNNEKNSRRVTETSYNENNEMTLVKAYNVKEKDTFNKSISRYKYVYEYDKYNNKTKIICDKNEKSSWVRKNKFKYMD